MARTKSKSRATRWAEAVSAGQDAIQAARDAYQEVQDLTEERDGLDEPEEAAYPDPDALAAAEEDHQEERDRLERDITDKVEEVQNALANLTSALEDLSGVREEYESWRDNMSDALQGTPTYEVLEALLDEVEEPTDVSVPDSWSLGDDEPDLDEAETLLETADGATLAYGWGRD